MTIITRDVRPNICQTTLPMARLRTSSGPLICLLLGVLLTVIAYYPGLSGDYTFDDMHNLVTNPRLGMKELNLETLQTASFSSGAGKLKRPVSMFTFALNRYYFGIDPLSYKVTNLAIHLLTGIALFWLATLIIRQYRRMSGTSLSSAAELWIPVSITAIWLVHPLNLTSVLYIVQRMTSLTALFTVLGLCGYIIGRSQLLDNRNGWPWIFTGLLGFGGLAVFSKENGILLPCYMFVIELALFRFRGRNNTLNRPVVLFFTLFLLLPGLVFLLMLAFHPGSFLSGYQGREFTLTERVMTESRVLVFYLKQIIAPSVSELGLYHDDIRISRSLLNPPTTLYASLALALLLALAVGLLKRLPLFSLGILWFFCGHALESTILPLEIAHEHRNYLADFGIILALGSLVLKVPGRRLAPYIRVVTPAIFLALLSYNTWVRANQWSDNVNHAVYEATHHPESPRAMHAAGRIYARLAISGHEESTDKAFDYLERASALNNTGVLSDITMVKLAFLLDRTVKQEWYDRITRKLRDYPVSAADLNGLHELASCQKNVCETPRATMESIYDTVLHHESMRNSGARLSNAYTSYGFYLINVHGEFVQGLDNFYLALEKKPDFIQNWINLIKVLVSMYRFDEAETRLEMFRAKNITGATERDYSRLANLIANKRTQANHHPHQQVTDMTMENLQ